MNILRIRQELLVAVKHFAYVELHPTTDGGVYVKAALQTSAGRTYVVAIHFVNYPTVMPTVHVTAPALHPNAKHTYGNGKLCLLHPSMWNPGQHNLTFVLGRTAKWLNKYEVWRDTGRWPGAELRH